jgi:hypothetical protein
MHLYVAGRFREYRRIREAIDKLIAAGNTITHDWTRSDEFNEHGEPMVPIGPGQSVEVLTDEEARNYAFADIRGVRDADAVVLMAGDGLYGALIEVGAALALSVEVWIVGDMPRDSVFFYLPLVRRFDTIEEVIDYIKSMN